MVYRKGLFSQRYKLVDAKTLFIRGRLSEEVANAIENCYSIMWDEYDKEEYVQYDSNELSHEKMERELWTGFLCNSISDFKPDQYSYRPTSIIVIKSSNFKWNDVLDMIEYTIKYIHSWLKRHQAPVTGKLFLDFVNRLNYEFKRLDFAYRIIDDEIVEITDDNEIKAIEQASGASGANVKEHLQKSMQHLSKRPDADASNSIKESISALEAVCRDLTGEATLGKSLKKLEAKGISIHPCLKDGLDKLYIYTNQPDTGIRHALMDADGNNVPSKDEAHLMLVLCSAFINYLRAKSASR